MKQHKSLLGLLLITILAVSGCRRDYPELEETLTIKTEFLKGTWKVAKVTQYDQQAIGNAYPKEVQSMDITSLFPFSQYTITFNLDAQNKPSTYTITPGQAPNLIALTSGRWEVDNPVFATRIAMFDPNSTSSGTFVVKRINNERIILRVERRDADSNPNEPDPNKKTLLVYYEYEFTR